MIKLLNVTHFASIWWELHLNITRIWLTYLHDCLTLPISVYLGSLYYLFTLPFLSSAKFSDILDFLYWVSNLALFYQLIAITFQNLVIIWLWLEIQLFAESLIKCHRFRDAGGQLLVLFLPLVDADGAHTMNGLPLANLLWVGVVYVWILIVLDSSAKHH